MADNKIDQEKKQEWIKKALSFVITITKAAGAVNPIFSVAGTVLQVVLDHEANKEFMKKVKVEFDKMNQMLNDISQENQQTLKDIRKAGVNSQCAKIEDNLLKHFNSYMEMVNAKPEDLKKRQEYYESLENYDDQYMNNLYEGVMGNPKAFSLSIKEVYKEHSKGDMENLCKRLFHLFTIGLAPMMTYYAIMGDDIESRKKEWKKKMEDVCKEMTTWM